MKQLDYVLENLFNLLETRKYYKIENDVDVLIVTDHGMATIREPNEDALKRHFYLSDYIDVRKHLLIDKCTYGSVSELWLANQDDLEYVYNKLKLEELIESDRVKIKEIYMKKDIPECFSLGKHRRVAPIVLLAKTGYQIILERENANNYSVFKYHGNHGYEPSSNELMRGIFLAKGKSFKKSHKSSKPVYLIDYYSLVCHLLDLEPNPNNGTFSRISHVLANEIEDEDLMQTLLTLGIIFIIFLIIISFVMPGVLIFSSVKLTCDKPVDLANKKK